VVRFFFLHLVSTLIFRLEIINIADGCLLWGQVSKVDKLYPLLTDSLSFQQHLKSYGFGFGKLFYSTRIIKKDGIGVKEELELDIFIWPLWQFHAFDFTLWSQ